MKNESPIIDLVDQMIFDCDHRLHIEIQSKPERIVLQMPLVLINFMRQELYRVSKHMQAVSPEARFFYVRGIQIIPSYEWSIILYHEDYTFHQEKWMINKVLLHDPLKENHPRYQKMIVDLNGSINLTDLMG